MPAVNRIVFFLLAALAVLFFVFSPSALPRPSDFGYEVPSFWRGTGKGASPPSAPPTADPELAANPPLPSPADAVIVNSTPAAEAPAAATTTASATGKQEEEIEEFKWYFQVDLDYKNPAFDTHKLKQYRPHNYEGPGQDVFATYLSTRNCTLHDPYFQAAQQLAYRTLWDPRSRSNKHPLVVFVAPFIPDENRDLLTAAGALVRELDLIEGHPTAPGFWRWKDLFSKLHMWDQTDFRRIAFLDLDAFPFQNIDGIFNISLPQRCHPELLEPEDRANESEICDYTFSGTSVGPVADINVGVVVFNPNKAMYQRLLRESRKLDLFDQSMAEQAFLNYAYRLDGPFPMSHVDRVWNGFFPQKADEGKLKIIHEKLWAISPADDDPLAFARGYFPDTWNDMLRLYESEEFQQLRAQDGARLI